MDVGRVDAFMKRVEESETKTFTPVSDKLKVGVDLGTAYIVLVVLDEEDVYHAIWHHRPPVHVIKDGVDVTLGR